MPYRFNLKKSLQKNLRRIAREQIERAMSELADDQLDRSVQVHQVRKRCKKIRGLVRLVRPDFQQYTEENAYFRDAASLLTDLRDAKTILATFDQLMSDFQDQVDRESFSPIRKSLLQKSQQVLEKSNDAAGRMRKFRELMKQSLNRVDKWSLPEKDFGTVRGGLQKTYTRARDLMKQTRHGATMEEFHEYRKRVKYHWYHCRLLQPIWPEVLDARRKQCDELGELLGQDHDLAVLKQTVKDAPDALGKQSEAKQLYALIDERRDRLFSNFVPIGEKMFAEKSKAFVTRMGKYWKVAVYH